MSLRSLGRRFAIAGFAASVAVVLGAGSVAAQPLPKLPRAGTSAPASAEGRYSPAADVPPSRGAVLRAGEALTENQSLQSPGGQHVLVINGYAGHQFGIVLTGYTGDPVVLSQTGTTNNVDNRLVMQGDGNLVLYSNGKATFHTGTHGKPGAYVQLQGDRNLVVYYQGKAVWASNTVMTNASSYYLDRENYEPGYLDAGWYLQSPNRRAKLSMQSDGNLVLYTSRGAVWSSRTNGNPGATATVQTDGNIVIYSSSGRALWNSGTARSIVGANVLQLQNDGNLVLYFHADRVTQVRWQTKTAGKI